MTERCVICGAHQGILCDWCRELHEKYRYHLDNYIRLRNKMRVVGMWNFGRENYSQFFFHRSQWKKFEDEIYRRKKRWGLNV